MVRQGPVSDRHRNFCLAERNAERGTEMSESKSLQDVLDEIGGPDQMVERMRNLRPDAYTVPIVPSEVSNWRAEQRAWRETAVLFDQSHHMDTVVVKGP